MMAWLRGWASAVLAVRIVRLEPDDVIVVEVKAGGLLSDENRDRIRRQLEDLWPGHKVAIFEQGSVALSFVRPTDRRVA